MAMQIYKVPQTENPVNLRPTIEHVRDTLFELSGQFDDYMTEIDEQIENDIEYPHPDFISAKDELNKLAEVRESLHHLEARIRQCLDAYHHNYNTKEDN